MSVPTPLRAGVACAVALALGGATYSAGSAQAAATPQLPAPSGRVTYQIKSSMINGTTVLSWAENGKRIHQTTKGTIQNGKNPMPINGWTIMDGTHLLSHQSMMGKQVMRMKLPKGGMNGAMLGLPGLGPGGQSGKVVGKATVLGKPCEIREQSAGKLWTWKGLPLKMQGSPQQGMQLNIVATKVEPGVKVSPSLFKLPAGFTVKDMQMPTPPRDGGNPHRPMPRTVR